MVKLKIYVYHLAFQAYLYDIIWPSDTKVIHAKTQYRSNILTNDMINYVNHIYETFLLPESFSIQFSKDQSELTRSLCIFTEHFSSYTSDKW